MITTVQERIKFLFAAPYLEHALLFSAVLESLTSLPALPPSYLICLHLQPVLLQPAEDVQAPVVPHRWTCPYDIVRLRVQLGQYLNRVEFLATSHFHGLLLPGLIFLVLRVLVVLGSKFLLLMILLLLLRSKVLGFLRLIRRSVFCHEF